jgi:hypothetical protein
MAVLAIDPFVDSASSTRVHAEQCHNTLLIVQEFSFVLRRIAVHAIYVIHVHEQRCIADVNSPIWGLSLASPRPSFVAAPDLVRGRDLREVTAVMALQFYDAVRLIAQI